MKIVQIAYTATPSLIAGCMQTVSTWAKANGHEYRVITAVPEVYADLINLRVISDYHRVDLLAADADTAYFDWDVRLLEGFTLCSGATPKFNHMGDNIMYSGDTTFWQKIREWMGDPLEHKGEIGRIFHALNALSPDVTRPMIIPPGTFEHLNYTRDNL